MTQLTRLLSIFVVALMLILPYSAITQAEGLQALKQMKGYDVRYTDVDYNFAFNYDSKLWTAQTEWYYPNHPQAHKINKRVQLIGEDAIIRIDIWKIAPDDLLEWLEEDAERRNVETSFAINATIAQRPAVIFFETYQHAPALLTTTFIGNNHLYRIQYIVGDHGNSLVAYHNLLNSLRLGDTLTSSFVEIPADMYASAKESSNDFVNTCCGVTDTGNPFPCSDGNCTWWVYYRQGYVPFTGDAETWRGGAYSDPEWDVSGSPVLHGIAWWGESVSRPDGHVAQVEQISGGNIRITEMTWQGSACSSEPNDTWIASSVPDDYLYYISDPLGE